MVFLTADSGVYSTKGIQEQVPSFYQDFIPKPLSSDKWIDKDELISAEEYEREIDEMLGLETIDSKSTTG